MTAKITSTSKPMPAAHTQNICDNHSEIPAQMREIFGTAGCRGLATAFYARVDRHPLLRPLFPGKSLRCAIEEFTAFLVQIFGGPSEDTQRRWWLSLHESHRRFKIGQAERDAWLDTMCRTLDEMQIEEPLRSTLREFFEQSSAYVANLTSERSMLHEIVRTDEAVAAVRRGELPAPLAQRAASVGLLALMIARDERAMFDRVREELTADPSLAQESYGGRTLLHAAAGAGNLNGVELLLQFGAAPNVNDAGGHTPLYSVANECRAKGGAAVVRALVQHGADVNACGGVKRCTPLHMAARRGNTEIAEALLECGADIEARDSRGDTPLQRALNCRKPAVANLLLAKGAVPVTR